MALISATELSIQPAGTNSWDADGLTHHNTGNISTSEFYRIFRNFSDKLPWLLALSLDWYRTSLLYTACAAADTCVSLDVLPSITQKTVLQLVSLTRKLS